MAGHAPARLGTGSALEDLLRRACRRWLWNQAVGQAAAGACVAVGSLIVLLVLGTQVVAWPWWAALLGVSLVFGLRRMRNRAPSTYLVAQLVDRNLGLHDSLSTALYYGQAGGARRFSEAMREAQRATAEALCRGLNLRRGVPLQKPQTLYLLLLLGVAASGLFALRYGLPRGLDLRRPLPRIVLDVLRPAVPERAAATRREKRLQEYWKQFGVTLDERATGDESMPGTALETVRGVEADSRLRTSAQPLQAGTAENAVSGDASEDGVGERLTSGEAGPGEGRSSGAPQRNLKSPEASDSLLDKFRDALSGLLARLRSSPKAGESPAAASAQAGADASAGRQSLAQRGIPGAGPRTAEGLPGSAAEEMTAGQGSAQASEGPGGRRGSAESSHDTSQEGRSGIGNEDGSKDIREAAQLAAMGRISEIIGRRSQTLTGEVMVEVTSGKQQLRTPYSRQEASHAEAGGEIHRDEIPLAYQSYVQRYFEEVRKPPAAQSRRPPRPTSLPVPGRSAPGS